MSFQTIITQLLEAKPNGCVVRRSDAATQARLACALQKHGKSVVLIAENHQDFLNKKAFLELFTHEEKHKDSEIETGRQWEERIILFPESAKLHQGKSNWADKIASLYSLQRNNKSRIILTGFDNLLCRLPPKNIFENHELFLQRHNELSPEILIEQAITWGYTRTNMVSVPGEIAVRGDILDIFCPGYPKPVRIEFFGDTIEDIRLFDGQSQRSIALIQELTLIPAELVLLDQTLLKHARTFWDEERDHGRLSKDNRAALEACLVGQDHKEHPPGIYYQNASFFEDWLADDGIYFLPDQANFLNALQEREKTWKESLSVDAETMQCKTIPDYLVLRSAADFQNCLKTKKQINFTSFLADTLDQAKNSYDFPERHYTSFQEIFPQTDERDRPWQTLVKTIKKWSKIQKRKAEKTSDITQSQAGNSAVLYGNVADGLIALSHKRAQLILSFSSERNRKRFLQLAAQEEIYPKLRYDADEHGIFALISSFRQGAALSWDTTLILGEDVMQPQTVRTLQHRHQAAFKGLSMYDQLQEGDLLVHRQYGVGLFGGLHRMCSGGVENDFLLLRYAGDDKLYLPVDRLSLIQRFKGADGLHPPLDRLGSAQWALSKDKAQKAVEKIAADLIEMYALRKVVKSFAYTPINELYREFEAGFGFEETPDQSKAIDDVLTDMEKAEPMDRLICGDVGFGKTEVAMRAAFRAVLEGRQVAVLCPTTILAEQHYQTFRRRLANFPVTISLLSRFVSKAQQEQTVQAAARGMVDIIIGTHRILSKDVYFPNLGLLILDEEQRFGVRDKERLKEIRKNVDALTLSATPIPRTLQLSLSGIRELSVIETPPAERKAVVSTLITKEDELLRDIIQKELDRQGQVFWVYNRVQGLSEAAAYVQRLVPTARVGIAHGQMPELKLENTMHQFWHGGLDVLVCTSIVESGLDFPRANTLIVDQAQMFGLGQLYQLRGRVGRSDQQAFAVFITPKLEKLSELARQRLQIILEMDFLGAGFHIAMEDLRLRGAGNILGESQSGHMNRLGLDLFLEMLHEAVAKLKGEKNLHLETELSLGLPAFIPDSYISDPKERLRYYKLLSSARDEAVIDQTLAEINDRYGSFPPELKIFIEVLRFKRETTRHGIAKADIFSERIRLSFSENSTPDPDLLIPILTQLQEGHAPIRLCPPGVLEFTLPHQEFADNITHVLRLLQKIMPTEQTDQDESAISRPLFEAIDEKKQPKANPL